MTGGALEGVRVLDFTTLLPGPLATAILRDAGAEIVKIERPEGEAGRDDAPVFARLNAGKRSIAIDLKRDAEKLHPLVRRCDILVEQFRPGVMERLRLGYAAVRAINPRILYVSINGYGADGPDATRPGHDLTYAAETGLLALNADERGAPVLPAALAADIGGGSHAALINILAALYRRERTGEGAHLQVSLFAGLLPFLSEAIAHARAGMRVAPGYSPATGSSPRYQIYPTADGRHLAVACPEEKFWRNFCERTGLSPDADRQAVARCLAQRSAAEWLERFEGADLCCSLVATVAEAFATPRMQRLIHDGGGSILDPALRGTAPTGTAPALGEGNDLLE